MTLISVPHDDAPSGDEQRVASGVSQQLNELTRAAEFGQLDFEIVQTSDVDVCLVLTQERRTSAQMSAKRLEYVREVDLDVQVLQQLPLYIRQRVLKDGRVLFVRNEDRLYELAFRTVQVFEDFRPRYQAYLDEVARA